jgi:nucleoside-diphosphate-sugar epimerase
MILIIGGAGYIGSLLTKILLDRTNKVLVADNLYKGGDTLFSSIYDNNFSFQYCDITKEKDVERLFSREIHGCILLSGLVGLPACEKHPSLAYAVNVDGWKNIIKYKPKRIPLVAASTGSIYGSIESGLCKEDETIPNPLSVYGKTKLLGEKFVTDNGGIALRFATCAGVSPNMRLNLLPNQLVYEAIINKSLTIFQADFMRTFIDIRDFCESLVFCLKNFKNLKYQVYNVGDEKNNWTKRQLAEFIKNKTGCYVNYTETFEDQDGRNYLVSYDRIHEERFYTSYSMEETIDLLIKSIPLIQIRNNYE